MLGLGSKKVLVVRPHPTSIGRQLLDVLHGLHFARTERASLYLLRPRRVLTDAYYAIESDAVRVLGHSWLLDGVLGGAWVTRNAVLLGARIARWAARRLRLEASPPPPPPPEPSSPTRRATFFGPAVRRSISAAPISVRFRADLERAMAAQAHEAGIDPDKPLAALHVREPGYDSLYTMRDRPQDRDRNAQIETYFPAIDLLVDKGFQVVRIGDRNMTSMVRDGVIDLATSSDRSPRLHAWCIAHAHLFLCCNSGPYVAALLLGTPTLLVNDTDMTANFAIRRTDRYLPKRVVDRVAERALSLAEVLEPETFLRIGADLQNEHRVAYSLVDNSPEEIRDAVSEMLESLDGETDEAVEQREFRERLIDLGRWLCHESSQPARWQGKLGNIATPYFGDGRIGSSFASKHLHGSEPTLAAARDAG